MCTDIERVLDDLHVYHQKIMKICGAVQVPSYPKSMEQQMRLRTLLAACPFFRGFPPETIEQARAQRLRFLPLEMN